MNIIVLELKLKQLKQQTDFARLHFVVYINTTYVNTYNPMGLPKRGYRTPKLHETHNHFL